MLVNVEYVLRENGRIIYKSRTLDISSGPGRLTPVVARRALAMCYAQAGYVTERESFDRENKYCAPRRYQIERGKCKRVPHAW